MTSLAGKIIVVTGAGRRLGRAFAEGAAMIGAAAVPELVYECGRSRLAALRKSGHEATFLALDSGEPGCVGAMADAVGKRYGRIDGLAYYSSIAIGFGGTTFEEIAIEIWDYVI